MRAGTSSGVVSIAAPARKEHLGQGISFVAEQRSAGKESSGHSDNSSSAGCLEALHGIRAIACIAIVFGHCMFALGFAWPDEHLQWYKALEEHPWMLVLVNVSEPAMDTFLILSGFLAAGSLLPAMQSSKTPLQVIKQYYAKRLRRMVPSYYATLAFVYTVFLPLLKVGNARAPEAQTAISTLWFHEGDGCPDKLWTNFFFLNNQMQFFLLSPLLMLCLRPAAQKGLAGRLAKACGLVIAAVTGHRALIALDFRLPVPVFGPLENPEALELMTRTLQVSYYSLLPRLTHLAFGMLGSCAVQSSHAVQFLERRKGTSSGFALSAGVLLYGTLLSNRFGPAPIEGHPLNTPGMKIFGVACITGLLQPAALTYLLCCAVLGLSQRATRMLTWKGWRQVADVSYDMYLLHPMVMYAVWTALPPSAWFHVGKPSAVKFVAVSSVVFWVSLGVATMHSRFWSHLMDHRRRYCKH